MRDAELAGNDDCSKGERAAHVDGAVVGGHGKGALLGEELRDEGRSRMGFCVDWAAAKPMRSASSSLKLVTCTRAHPQITRAPGMSGC